MSDRFVALQGTTELCPRCKTTEAAVAVWRITDGLAKLWLLRRGDEFCDLAQVVRSYPLGRQIWQRRD